MEYQMADYAEEMRNKMKRWGIIKEHDDEIVCVPTTFTTKQIRNIAEKHTLIPIICSDIAFTVDRKNQIPFQFGNWFFDQALMVPFTWSEETNLEAKVKQLENRCRLFTQRLQELEKKQKIKREPTLSEIIYEEKKAELEENYFGKIVAIDNVKKEIVGIGDTILEAYNNAKENSENDKFSYIRVGYTDKV